MPGYVVKLLRTLTLICMLIWGHVPTAAAQVETTDAPIEVTAARLAASSTTDPQTTVLDPVTPRTPFDGIVFTWHIDGNPNHVRLAFRVRIDDVWQSWQSLVASDEFRHEDATADEYTSTLYSFAQSVNAWQVSVMYAQNTDTRLTAMQATTMSSLHVSPRINPNNMAAPEAAGAKPSIVARATWGGSTVQDWDSRGNACAATPASCPADATWMPESSEIGAPTHIIIHHTATPNYHITDPLANPPILNRNWSSIVRNIWQFHASSNNWGDIGYHFLIDPNGVIYEGRYTGVRDNGTVINGAHAYAFNYGSIGISMIGTYSAAQPTPAAQTSLHNVLSWLVAKYNITPGVERPYRPHPLNSNYPKYVNYNGGAGVKLNTIEGHRVTGALASQIISPGWGTTCPGDAFYAMLPDIRQSIQMIPQSLQTTLGSGDIYVGQTFKLPTRTDQKQVLTWTSANDSCTISKRILSVMQPGNCVVIASAPTRGAFMAFSQMIEFEALEKLNRTLSASLPTDIVGTNSVEIPNKTDDFTSISWTIAQTSKRFCTIKTSAGKKFLVGKNNGVCTFQGRIKASKSHNAYFVEYNANIHPKQTQTLAPLPPLTIGGRIDLASTSIEGISVSWKSTSKTCKVIKSTMPLQVQGIKTGNCTLIASNKGNDTYDKLQVKMSIQVNE